jgi:hypothetical protein
MTTTTTTARRGLAVGSEVSITGVGGRFVVRRIADNGDITCWGGRPNHAGMRTFKADRIKTVHYRKPTPARTPEPTPAPTIDIAKGRAPARRNPRK